MQLKLDRRALRDLIEADPEFKLELQRSVLSEVVRNLFQKDIGTILEVGDKAFLKEIVDTVAQDTTILADLRDQVAHMLAVKEPGFYGSKVKLHPDIQKVVVEAGEQAVAKVRNNISKAVDDAFEKAWATRQDILEGEVERRVNAKFNATINNTVELRVRERLDQIAKGITG